MLTDGQYMVFDPKAPSLDEMTSLLEPLDLRVVQTVSKNDGTARWQIEDRSFHLAVFIDSTARVSAVAKNFCNLWRTLCSSQGMSLFDCSTGNYGVDIPNPYFGCTCLEEALVRRDLVVGA